MNAYIYIDMDIYREREKKLCICVLGITNDGIKSDSLGHGGICMGSKFDMFGRNTALFVKPWSLPPPIESQVSSIHEKLKYHATSTCPRRSCHL